MDVSDGAGVVVPFTASYSVPLIASTYPALFTIYCFPFTFTASTYSAPFTIYRLLPELFTIYY
jgi:hypothetical protein